MKLPSINCSQVSATPTPTRFDVRFGKLDANKCELMAAWGEQYKTPAGWERQGPPTATFWRTWKIRKKAIFAAGISIRKGSPFILIWKSPTPFVALEVKTPSPVVPKPSRGVLRSKRTLSRKGLLKHQPVAVERHIHALEKFGGTLEASGTGVGKTFIALATAREMELKPQVICPKNVVSAWQDAADFLKVKVDFVTNYEQLTVGSSWQALVGRTGKSFEWKPRKKVMTIFDEAHKLKNAQSLNAALALAARLADQPTMQLSATIAQDPTEMSVIGQLLGLHQGGQSFYEWGQQYGCLFDGMGLIYRGKPDDMQRLHLDLFPEHGSRIRPQDLPDFPQSFIIPRSFDVEDPEGLQTVYDDMAHELELHASKIQADGMKILNALCAMTRYRQQAELMKVPTFVELITNLVAEGHSVPFFVNYSETLNAILQRLPMECAIVRGGQNKKGERAGEVAKFQNEEVRVIGCQMRAGGESISLHDLTGNFPRASCISPGFSAREVIQACGRTPRAKGKTKCLQYIVFAKHTIEDAACRRIQKCANNIELLNDGDLMAGFSIT